MIRIHSCCSGNLNYMTTVYIFQKTLDSKKYAKICIIPSHLIVKSNISLPPSVTYITGGDCIGPLAFFQKVSSQLSGPPGRHMMSFLPPGWMTSQILLHFEASFDMKKIELASDSKKRSWKKSVILNFFFWLPDFPILN